MEFADYKLCCGMKRGKFRSEIQIVASCGHDGEEEELQTVLVWSSILRLLAAALLLQGNGCSAERNSSCFAAY